MKTKSTNRFVSLALALIMLLTCVSFSPLAFRASAADDANPNKHVLDGAKDFAALIAEKGEDVKSNTPASNPLTGTTTKINDFFTIYWGDKGRIDDRATDDANKFADEYAPGYRINFGGNTNTSNIASGSPTRVVGFKTDGAATVKVWWISNYNATQERGLALFDSTGKVEKKVLATNGGVDITTWEISEGGQYYIGGETGGAQYIYKIEVEETPAEVDYTLDGAKDFAALIAEKGEDVKSNTPASNPLTGTTTKINDFFTIYWGDKGRIDDRATDDAGKFADEYAPGYRINFGGNTNTSNIASGSPTRVVGFKTDGAATIKVWWISNYNATQERGLALFDSTGKVEKKVLATNGGVDITTWEISEGGQYYIGGETGGAQYIYKIVVTTGAAKKERGPWDAVEAPVITSAEDDGEGNIVVMVDAVVGNDGGDGVAVVMTDKDGNVSTKQSIAEKDKDHKITFTPSASGTYSFKAYLYRGDSYDDEEALVLESEKAESKFTLVLKAPTIASATSKGTGSDGKGTAEVVWNPVDEATGYIIYVDGEKVGEAKADETSYTVTGLTVGNEYKITVAAVRGTEESKPSEAKTVKATAEEQRTWGHVFYGQSTKAADNYAEVTGELGNGGSVKVVSKGGSGKFNEATIDGVSFFYTAIPTSLNFTLKAKVHIDTWTLTSGQEGTAIMAIDRLPTSPNSSAENWTNMYRVGAMDFSYNLGGNKYQMNIGIGYHAKTGITPDNVQTVYDVGAAGIVNFEYGGLETYAYDYDKARDGAVTTSIVGNCTNASTFVNPAPVSFTDFILELKRDNTGYLLTYYAEDGKTIVGQQRFYGTDALDQLDKDFVYVGFASARNMEATYSDIELTTIAPEDDAPAEERPITEVTPKVTFASNSTANSTSYKLLVKSNVVGTANIIVAGKTVKTDVKLDGSDDYVKVEITIAPGSNKIEVVFTPDADQPSFDEYTKLASTDPITASINVQYNTYYEKQNNLYVSPNGTKGGNGSQEYPLDIYTAVTVVAPGQTIILMEGTYKLETTLEIPRGISGTIDEPIRMIADPEAKTRPVLDFQSKAGMSTVGDYWYFYGFDVTKSANGVPGIYVSGNHCTYENINTYKNQDCGIYIRSKNNSSDPKSLWPSYNLILNCTSYDNADNAGENADGFAAKFTVGKGNVFDGCVSYNNCDDGWDLYARGQSIEPVTLRNCVAYNNGHNIDGSIKGNGNGFKLGGENMSGFHVIENSIAFNNDANGITCNSCPDITIRNCISVNNGGANVSLYSSKTTAFVVEGLVSFKGTAATPAALSADGTISVTVSGADGDAGDSLTLNGQELATIQSEVNYYWPDGNTAGVKASADWFESLEFKGLTRSESGQVNLGSFLKLTDKAPKNIVFDTLDGDYKPYEYSYDYVMVSGNAVEEDDPSTLPAPETGFEFAIIVSVVAISAAAALVLFKKRRSSK